MHYIVRRKDYLRAKLAPPRIVNLRRMLVRHHRTVTTHIIVFFGFMLLVFKGSKDQPPPKAAAKGSKDQPPPKAVAKGSRSNCLRLVSDTWEWGFESWKYQNLIEYTRIILKIFALRAATFQTAIFSNLTCNPLDVGYFSPEGRNFFRDVFRPKGDNFWGVFLPEKAFKKYFQK